MEHVQHEDELAQARGSGLELSQIHTMDRTALLSLQVRIGLGSDWGQITAPNSWVPAGSSVHRLSLDLRKLVDVPSASTSMVDWAVQQLVRWLLLCLLAPVGGRSCNRYLKYTTVAGSIYDMAELARLALLTGKVRSGAVFSCVGAKELGNHRNQERAHRELGRLEVLCKRGFWNDSAAVSVRTGKAKAEVASGKKEKSPWLPLNDEFVAEAGWRVIWLIEVAGPPILDLAEAVLARMDVTQQTLVAHGVSEAMERTYVLEAANDLISTWQFVTPSGIAIVNLPFSLCNFVNGNPRKVWPPKNTSDLRFLLMLLQSSHMFFILLSTGGRIHELLSQSDDGLTENMDGVEGTTSKHEASVKGRVRDWPLPRLGVLAFQQQVRLNRVLVELGMHARRSATRLPNTRDSIWTGPWGAEIATTYNGYLQKTVRSLDLQRLISSGLVHAHRFRKTLARLIGLAIVGAPKIIMDIFGHEQIQQSIGYMMSDPDMVAEVQEVARAQTVMLGAAAIGSHAENGGPVAKALHEKVEREELRLGSDYGAKNVQELAEILTFNGRQWLLVRPGVVCTKQPHQVGPCIKKSGAPDIAKCRSTCGSRLELGALREEVDLSIQQALTQLQEALADGREMDIEMWKGQVLANLNRFPDIAKKWREDGLVAEILKEEKNGQTNFEAR